MAVPAAFTYLNTMNEVGASDLYLTVGTKPTFRVEDELRALGDTVLDQDSIAEIINSIFTPKQKREFDIHWELNTSLDLGAYGRFRVNAMKQRQTPSLVIRRIVTKIPSLEDLKLPPILADLALEKRGLILLTGMTGSGKSTTLASMVDIRNKNRSGHILTIEDPIEYFHQHNKSVVTQREIGVDTESYATALKNSLRQRPDVILVGEIRDAEVMEQALMIAETGHLCLSTLHTNNAYQAIERIVNFFPEEHQNQARLNLSMNLKAIISQRLIPSLEGGQVPALEIMINQGLVRDIIRKGEYDQITNVMEQNNPLGMRTFDQSLLDLYAKGFIDEETAIAQSDKSSNLKVKIKQFNLSQNKDGLKSLDTSRLSIDD